LHALQALDRYEAGIAGTGADEIYFSD